MQVLRCFTASLIASLGCGLAVAADPETSTYTPQPVYCADNSGKLCAVVPSFIGPDPLLTHSVGYSGLSNDVTSADNDVQTPFDNMAWQMFVALNWQANQQAGDPKTGLSGKGPTVWQTWSHPEDVFGGPAGSCANPNNLPRFNLIAKSDAQSRDEEFQQATGQPLIDINGNWTLYERRLNDVEKNYITSNGLDSLAGQQIFANAGKTVDFPAGDMTKTNGAVGAIEVKAAWRIISDAERASYFNLRGLIDVEGEYVSDGKPLCQEATLGLVGLHLIQNNGPDGNLLPQFIWASFEHQSNAPLGQNACDATDPDNCFKTIPNNACPASSSDTNVYSYHNAACSAAGTNVPPQLKDKQSAYLWRRTVPYAGNYTTTTQDGTLCGTQVARCWQVYQLTQQLNTDWRAQLTAIDSVFANYFLIGTNWGGNVEPDGTEYVNGSVPTFMGNSTLETYIQTDPNIGNCVDCHKGANLAYTKPGPDPKQPTRYSADFSFLLGLANKQCTDVDAGPIWDNGAAQTTCPKVCGGSGLAWNGQWTTTVPGTMSVCGCCIATEVAAK